MQTQLKNHIESTARLKTADDILRSCVHCGFCNATCPTYLLLGDERDGPRGRIYLIKNVLEGRELTRTTQTHLDRCLTCRNCETTCPSGVQYHTLLDIGREVVERRVKRPLRERALRAALRYVVPRPGLLGAMVSVGRKVQRWLPAGISQHVPVPLGAARGESPAPRHARQVLMLDGCVQPGLAPNINLAAARVLDRLGVSVVPAKGGGCCGANDLHLGAQEAARQKARRNIDAWWPLLEKGAEAVVSSASGCGAFIKEYGQLLADDQEYAQRASALSARTRDLVEMMGQADWAELVGPPIDKKVAFHCPCTLQHAQRLGGQVEKILTALGAEMTAVPDAHLCCGAAGSYFLTQAELSGQLREQKQAALDSGSPDVTVTANIGCQMHLSKPGKQPVRHWIELVDEAIAPQGGRHRDSKAVHAAADS